MKYLFSIFLFTLVCTCCGQADNVSEKLSKDKNPKILINQNLNSLITFKVPNEKNPKTPSQDSLESLNLIPYELLRIGIDAKGGKQIKKYKMDSLLFDGWSIQIFNENEHRFRYTHYSNGLADWQIGYFDNGELDHDFRMKDGVNCGSVRMWQKGGCPYINTYFLEGGVADGPAYAWHQNCSLSRDALFKNNRILYEVKFDQQGKIVEKHGEIPEKYK